MRPGVVLLTVVLTAGPAAAAGLTIPEAKPLVSAGAYSSPVIEQPWVSEKPDVRLTERPMGELIAAKLGVAHGSAELFRLQVENGGRPTTLDGVVDGGGIKLKLTW